MIYLRPAERSPGSIFDRFEMTRILTDHLTGILATLPTKPGCYLMKDPEARVIYVGKAINLRNRVRSYFHASANHDRRIDQLVGRIADIEWIVVASELEALILEMNLIKKHRPHYNVRLKDDKRYPYIKVHWADPFPKVTVTRHILADGSPYFGPYTSVWAVHKTLDVLRRVFPYLTCDRVITGPDERACLYFDIKLCTAPCIGKIDQAAYRQMISDLCDFLNGRTESIVARLNQEMEQASVDLRFEKAAAIRDQLRCRAQAGRFHGLRRFRCAGHGAFRAGSLCAGVLHSWRQVDRPRVLHDGEHRRVTPCG